MKKALEARIAELHERDIASLVNWVNKASAHNAWEKPVTSKHTTDADHG